MAIDVKIEQLWIPDSLDAPDAAELARRVALAEAGGVPRKEAMRAVASAVGVPRSVVYDAVQAAKHGA